MLNFAIVSLANHVSVPATIMDNVPGMHEESNILNPSPCAC